MEQRKKKKKMFKRGRIKKYSLFYMGKHFQNSIFWAILDQNIETTIYFFFNLKKLQWLF